MKYLRWIIIALLSVYFAEVVSGSFKYPLLDSWGYMAVIPIYGLHTLVLLYLCRKELHFNKLYMAGVLFGLYEAYLTKVLWTGLSPDAFHIGSIAILDFIVLVFLWHPIMSFIVPLYVYEYFFTDTKIIKTPKIHLWFVILFIGIAHAVNYSGPIEVLKANLLILIPLMILYVLNKKHLFTDIIPSRSEFIVLSVILALYYVVMGVLIKPEVLNLWNQVVIWVIYRVVILLFYRVKEANHNHRLHISIYHFLYIVAIPTIVTLFYGFGVRNILMVSVWMVWIVMGIYLFVKVLLSVRKT